MDLGMDVRYGVFVLHVQVAISTQRKRESREGLCESGWLEFGVAFVERCPPAIADNKCDMIRNGGFRIRLVFGRIRKAGIRRPIAAGVGMACSPFPPHFL